VKGGTKEVENTTFKIYSYWDERAKVSVEKDSTSLPPPATLPQGLCRPSQPLLTVEGRTTYADVQRG